MIGWGDASVHKGNETQLKSPASKFSLLGFPRPFPRYPLCCYHSFIHSNNYSIQNVAPAMPARFERVR